MLPRKKAHADSGTITILARERNLQTAETDRRRGGLQVLVGDDVWADVPTLAGGARDGAEGSALLVNVGNQLQAWSDGRWRSTKHRVTNPAYVTFEEDTKTFDENVSTRRVSVAFFHKANYDAAVDAKELLAFGGFGEAAARDVAARNAPVVTAGELSRVGMLRKFAKQGMDAAQASMAYHEALMGAEAAAEAAGSSSGADFSLKKKARRERSLRVATSPRARRGATGFGVAAARLFPATAWVSTAGATTEAPAWGTTTLRRSVRCARARAGNRAASATARA